MSRYKFGQTLVKRDQFDQALAVGDLVTHVSSGGSSVYFRSCVILGETGKRLRIGTLGKWMWDPVSQEGVNDPRIFDTSLVKSANVIKASPDWPHVLVNDRAALKAGDYDG